MLSPAWLNTEQPEQHQLARSRHHSDICWLTGLRCKAIFANTAPMNPSLKWEIDFLLQGVASIKWKQVKSGQARLPAPPLTSQHLRNPSPSLFCKMGAELALKSNRKQIQTSLNLIQSKSGVSPALSRSLQPVYKMGNTLVNHTKIIHFIDIDRDGIAKKETR